MSSRFSRVIDDLRDGVLANVEVLRVDVTRMTFQSVIDAIRIAQNTLDPLECSGYYSNFRFDRQQTTYTDGSVRIQSFLVANRVDGE